MLKTVVYGFLTSVMVPYSWLARLTPIRRSTVT